MLIHTRELPLEATSHDGEFSRLGEVREKTFKIELIMRALGHKLNIPSAISNRLDVQLEPRAGKTSKFV